MTGELFLIPMLLVIGVSYLIVRAAAIALTMTGLDEKRARFQALSAFSGTGFTTKEAELIVNHPQRRKIVTWLMILGNAGLVTVIVTATSSLVTSDGYHIGITALIIILGIFLVFSLVSRNAIVKRWENFVEFRFLKWGFLAGIPTEDLVHFLDGYGLIRVVALEDSPFVGRSISDMVSQDSELVVIGIERGNKWISLPQQEEIIANEDTLVIYGHLEKWKKAFTKNEGKSWKGFGRIKMGVSRKKRKP